MAVNLPRRDSGNKGRGRDELKLLYQVKNAVFSGDFEFRLDNLGRTPADAGSHSEALRNRPLNLLFNPILKYLEKRRFHTVVVPNFWMNDYSRYVVEPENNIFGTAIEKKRLSIKTAVIEIQNQVKKSAPGTSRKFTLLSDYACKTPLVVRHGGKSDYRIGKKIPGYRDRPAIVTLDFTELTNHPGPKEDSARRALRHGLLELLGHKKHIDDEHVVGALNTLLTLHRADPTWQELWYVPLHRPGLKPLAVCLTFVYEPRMFMQVFNAFEAALQIGFAAAAVHLGPAHGTVPELRLNGFMAYKKEDHRIKAKIQTQVNKECQSYLNEGLWTDGELRPGERWKSTILKKLNQADLILILLSRDFLTKSRWCLKELRLASKREKKAKCRVIPIIIERGVDLPKALKHLTSIGKPTKPVRRAVEIANAAQSVAGVAKDLVGAQLGL